MGGISFDNPALADVKAMRPTTKAFFSNCQTTMSQKVPASRINKSALSLIIFEAS